MSQIVLTPLMEASFQGFRSPVEVCDSQGHPVGLFLPMEGYKKMLASLKIPYSQEELERRKAEQGGRSLRDFWKGVDST